MGDELLQEMQSKIAFLEHASTELSDVVFRQHLEIKALQSRLQTLIERLGSAAATDVPRTLEQERPPHY
jgi:SlyX protein